MQEDSVIQEKKVDLEPPPLYQVALLNDDYTPMEFVILVLEKFFKMDRNKATHVMLKVHEEGKGVCGVFPKDVASTKVNLVRNFSKSYQHPLQCTMERA